MSTVCDLSEKHCVPCEGGVPTIERAEAETLLQSLEGWNLSEDGSMINRRFEFRGFFRTMSFINAMAWVVNEQGHHPDFSAGYNYCEVGFTTHAINGLSENDFICAARVNALLTA
ncbi:MAG: 4a-hydroxytetrahydrobiopterin dehydratase [Lysobacterales bacterium]|jgi:4a-hydroxytetrahydrobiopterin dehydratase